MKKESLKSRILAESFYNELWQLEQEKEELEVQLEIKDGTKKRKCYIKNSNTNIT